MSELLPEGFNGVVHGRGAIVPLELVPFSDTVEGSPRQGVKELGPIGGCDTGIWELRGGTVTDTESDEVFVVLSGGASIEMLDEGRTVEVKAGDVMRLTAGTRTKWTVPDHIRKVYVCGSPAGDTDEGDTGEE